MPGDLLHFDVGEYFFLTMSHVPPPDDWVVHASCASVDTNIFFPSYGKKQPDRTEEALAFCAGCPVRSECRAYGLRHPMLRGIWGGLTEADRKHIRHDRLSA